MLTISKTDISRHGMCSTKKFVELYEKETGKTTATIKEALRFIEKHKDKVNPILRVSGHEENKRNRTMWFAWIIRTKIFHEPTWAKQHKEELLKFINSDPDKDGWGWNSLEDFAGNL